MSSPGIVSVVEQIVDGKVQANEMFTAHDVTLEARNRGHKAYHNEVRDAVHDYYSRGGMGVAYTRTNISVPGGQPYLYHRLVDDPQSYSRTAGKPGHVIPVPPPSSVGNTDDDDDDDDDDDGNLGTISIPAGLLSTSAPATNGHHAKAANIGKTVGRSVDARATLSIPAPLIRKAGFQPQQKVYVVATSDGVEITDDPPQSGIYKRYTVDCNSQVRITQAMLKRAGIGGDSYDVSGDSQKVTVKLHK